MTAVPFKYAPISSRTFGLLGAGMLMYRYLSPFSFILVAASLLWLFCRLLEVLKRPVDDLVKLLGLEIPPAPDVSLLDITSTSVAIHWKPPEQKQAVTKYAVRVNGTLVDELPPQETSINVTNLCPNKHYVVRVIATNSFDFQSPGEAIRVRTPAAPLMDHDSYEDYPEQTNNRRIAVIQYEATGDISQNWSSAPAMAREHSANHLHPKRSGLLRRPSPSPSTDQLRAKAVEGQRQHDPDESVQQLTAKLDSLRRDIQEAEKHEEEEKEDHQENSKTLTERREALRQQLKDRDDESKELKKIVTGLERQQTAAQSKKSAQEKLRQQKLSEREKMKDEIDRWEREARDMDLEGLRLTQQQEDHHMKSEQEIEEITVQQQADQRVIEELEQNIHEKKALVRALEDAKNNNEQDFNQGELHDRQSREQAEDAEWKRKLGSLQARLSQAFAECNHAQYLAQQAQQRFEYINTRRGSQPGPIIQNIGPDAMNEGFPNEQGNSSRLNLHAPPFPAPAFMSQNLLPNRNPPGPSIMNRPTSEFIPFSQRAPTPHTHSPASTMPPSIIDQLTGGALTSPGADALLPSNLLRDEIDDMGNRENGRSTSGSIENFNTSRAHLGLSLPPASGWESSTFAGPLPGLGVVPGPNLNEYNNNPASPNSLVESRSPSLISSPQASSTQLHQYKLSDPQLDSDRRSVRSMSTSSRPPKTSRMFGPLFSRQRGKTTSEDGPALGSLKQVESQSMPRHFDLVGEAGEPTEGQPKKAATTGNFFSQMSNATVKPLSMFSSRGTPWSRSATTDRGEGRPFPSFPSENALPLPDAVNQPFGWPSEEHLSQPNGVRSGLIPGAYPSSLYSSKRQSIFEDTTESPLEDIQQLDEDSQELPLEDRSPPQAPIGTKPSKNKNQDPAAQLNPNARDFRSMFRTRTSEKTTPKSRKKDKNSTAEETNALSAADASPPESRKSKEDRYSSAADSLEDVNESANDSGVSTPLDGTPHSGTKESLMRRLTRKSSSTKFMPSFSKKTAASEEADDDGTPTKGEKGAEGMMNSPQPGSDKRSGGFSLSSFKGRRKKGMDAPSISETSMASETGDEDESSRPSAEE